MSNLQCSVCIVVLPFIALYSTQSGWDVSQSHLIHAKLKIQIQSLKRNMKKKVTDMDQLELAKVLLCTNGLDFWLYLEQISGSHFHL